MSSLNENHLVCMQTTTTTRANVPAKLKLMGGVGGSSWKESSCQKLPIQEEKVPLASATEGSTCEGVIQFLGRFRVHSEAAAMTPRARHQRASWEPEVGKASGKLPARRCERVCVLASVCVSE